MKNLILCMAVLFAKVPGGPAFSTFCPPYGDGGDAILNELKNRTAAPDSFQAITARRFLDIMPRIDLHRAHMDEIGQADRGRIDSLNGIGVALEGYLIGAGLANPQSAECHDPKKARYGLWIAPEKPASKKRRAGAQAHSVMAMVTPQGRATHPRTWQLETLSDLAWNYPRVRVYGWILLNPERPDKVGKTRATLWEVHPVVKIETWSGGRWVPF